MDDKTHTLDGDTHELAARDEASTTVFDVPVLAQLDYLSPSDRPDSLGRLGPYEILSVIGKGLAGLIFKAHDTRLDRKVAVKPLAPELAADAGIRERFLREAQTAAVLNDPHVVTIRAVETDGPVPLLVMDLIEGQSLRERIEQAGTLRLREILDFGAQIASGLAAAHRLGLIHCDLKPANILLEDGNERVRISGFGLARALDDTGARMGQVGGTPQYMSPERIQGQTVDARSDLFSLGSVMYAMCTGRSPFRGITLAAVMLRIRDEEPRPIHEVNPDIPPYLGDIIDRLLAKDPKERFQSADEVKELLERHLARLQVTPPLPASKPDSPRPDVAAAQPEVSADLQRKSGCLLRGAAVVLLVLTAGAGGAVYRDQCASPQHAKHAATGDKPNLSTPARHSRGTLRLH